MTDLNRVREYTHLTVRIFLRPVAFCVVLLFGAGPAATIACELACSSPSGHGEHGAAAHHSPAAEEDGAPGTGEFPWLTSHASDCDHDVIGSPALTAPAVKVSAPAALNVLDAAVADIHYTETCAVASSTASPPGPRPGPLPLRI